MPIRRPISTDAAVVGLSLFLVATCNVAFWRALATVVSPHSLYEYAFITGVGVLAFCAVVLLLGVVALPYVFKPAATLLLLGASASAYFASEYGTVIDADMLRNVLATDRGEASDLLTAKLATYVLCLGILPSALLWAWPIVHLPARPALVAKGRAALVIGALVAVTALAFSQNIMSVFRQHRLLLDMLAPINIVSATTELVRKQLKPTRVAAVTFGADAHQAAGWARRSRKSVTVIVVGETARAANFSLNGYARDTNPQLARVPDLVNFTQAWSCGTNTGHSLPCMFSGMGAKNFRLEVASHREGLLDIVQRAGFSVLWRENQAGCYGVCKRVPTEAMERAGTKVFFELGESLDETLLAGLQAHIDRMPGHAVIVLHMMGSHGPAYHKRYPPAFERFTPTCKESQFSRCEKQAIVNSYDNTLVYSDHVLARLIELLADNDRRDRATAMIYLSDHGESLGENNLYLHGLPYAFAPDVQKRIPMLLWLSPNYRTDAGVDIACLQRSRDEPTSHDNLFHSVLGLLDVTTTVYSRDLDLFAPCRPTRIPE